MVQEKNLLGFFDPGFDGLPAVVALEPTGQVFGHWIRAKME